MIIPIVVWLLMCLFADGQAQDWTFHRLPPSSLAGSDCRDAEDRDGYSDCPDLADFCDEPLYENLMREQCPYTCDYCDDSAYWSEEESTEVESEEEKRTVVVNHPILPWSMNRSKNPCDDFYGYVCDGYIASAVIPDDAYEKGSFSDAQDMVDQRLFELFANRAIALATVSDPFTPMIFPLFGACTNLAQRDQAGAKHLVGRLSQINKYSTVGELAEQLYHFTVNTDPHNNREFILELGGSQPVFNDPNLYNDQSPEREAVIAHITRLLGYLCDDDPQRKVFLLPTSIDRIVKNFEEIDSEIFANNPQGAGDEEGETKKPEDYDNPLAGATFLSLAEFRQKIQEGFIGYWRCQALSWTCRSLSGLAKSRPCLALPLHCFFETDAMPPFQPCLNVSRVLEKWLPPTDISILQSRFGADLARMQLVMDADSVAGTEKTLKKFSSTPQELEKLRDYAMVTFLQGWATHLDSRFQEALEELGKATSQGKSKRPNSTKECKKTVVEYFPHLADRLYVRRYFDEAIKVDVTSMVTNIISSTRGLITGVEWMDPATRQRALTKLDSMRKVVAYSEQLFNESEIQYVYGNMKIRDGMQYLEMVDHLMAESLRNQFRGLAHPPSWDYEMPYISINSYYNPTFNSMNILMGMLRGVFYGRDMPTALNYGAIGVVIGHEITHGFDNMGRWFDETGNYADWWEPDTAQRFNEKKQCLIDEYGNYSYQVNSTYSAPIDGARTQGENIADNGGYRASLYALRSIIGTESKKRRQRRRQIRGMEMYSDEQLFFIGSALWLCSTEEELLLMRMLRDEHPPDKVRVTVSLRNMDEFSKAFACPIGSPMNPADKCRVW